MKMVVIGGDTHLRDAESSVSERMRLYAQHIGHMSVFVLVRTEHFSRHESAMDVVSVSWPRALIHTSLWKAIRAADVVSVQDPFFIGLIGMIVSSLCGKPLHVQIHTDIYAPGFATHRKLNRVRLWCAAVVLRAASRIRVVTRGAETALRNRGIRTPITYLPIYVEVDSFARVVRKPHSRRAVAFLGVGRLESEKRFTKAIDALALVRSQGHDAELTLVGSGSQEALLRAYAHKTNMSDYVYFEGHQKDIKPYLETATALLVPSSYEGYGMVIIEALAARVPVLSTPVGVAEEAGAIVVGEATFAEEVLAWLTEGNREGVLRGYPYTSKDEYVRAWVEDVKAVANKAA